ncbi:MAG TPA: bifunctional alpha,alpha-trehalose-phosphate synthase (UDP-forming)/trehalose-phosphatase [Longimicrobiales bacterium]|nr:bifunctional alpha,alpha-trehalose-phosphate synthase (UDP-forming)/trehalose-phosphatase [Longimicrobiales bacterium]
MSRLLLVSNRLPVALTVGPRGVHVEPTVGGLATGLREPHARSHGLWIGWPGPLELDTEAARAELRAHFERLGIVPVYLSAREVRRYYEGFANSVLWPLFHYLTGQVPLRVEGWSEYVAANRRFAEETASHARADDMIWVHDYQLMLVPGMIRQRVPRARIGFFLHIPFPSAELFATLPTREELLRGMLGADLIGFHTDSYRRHFAATIERVLGVRVRDHEGEFEGQRFRLGVFPMGVDAPGLAQRARSAEVAAEVHALTAGWPGRLLLGIDRLDYTKGIPRRLLAYQEMLRRRPEWHGQVRLLQIAVPSRTGVRSYRHFREEVDGLVGHINGEFGTAQWMPVHYLYRSVPETQLLALYRAAHAMLVTPVRDGMNLVAKEFVAVREDELGVLVLSEFAGAADELQQAIIINPYNIEQAAEAYHRALTMPVQEQRERMRVLRTTVFENDVRQWVSRFLAELDPAAELRWSNIVGEQPTLSDVAEPALPPNALAVWNSLASRFDQGSPVLFLDYDGTLTRIVRHPRDALLSGDMRAVLERIAALLPVVLVSGRAREDLLQRVGIAGLIYAGSHGFDIAGPHGLRHEVASDHIPLLERIAQDLESRMRHIAGVVVEAKRFSAAVHYRMVARADVPAVLAVVDALVQDEPRVRKTYGKKVVEIRPAVDWDKGYAVRWLMTQLSADYDVLPIYLGDDLTDEDAFAAIGDDGVTVLVGDTPRPTRAQYSLRNVEEVRGFMMRIADRAASTAVAK